MRGLHFIILLLSSLLLSPLEAQPEEPTASEAVAPIPVAANEVLVTVNGLVCSFCAQGVERSLGKLGQLDKSKYKNGVFVDADNQRVVLAFQAGAEVPQAEIKKRIKKAGYDPTALFLGSGL